MKIRILDKRQTEQEEFYRSVVTDKADWAEFRRLNYKFSQCQMLTKELRKRVDAVTYRKTRLTANESEYIGRNTELRRRICAKAKEFARLKYAIIEKAYGTNKA